MPTNFVDYNNYVTTTFVPPYGTYWQPVTCGETEPTIWTNYNLCFEDIEEESQFPESPELDSFLDSFRII